MSESIWDGWFQKTDEVLGLLRQKSAQVTEQLDDAVSCMSSVKDSMTDLVNSCGRPAPCRKEAATQSPIQSTHNAADSQNTTDLRGTTDSQNTTDSQPVVRKKYVMQYPEEGDVLFLRVTNTGLQAGLSTVDETFWCAYWAKNIEFSSDCTSVKDISNAFSALVESSKAEQIETKCCQEVVWCYSVVYKFFLRAVVLSYRPTRELKVLFVDLGTVEIIPPYTEFYKLPLNHVKQFPFMKIHCLLALKEGSSPLPREARWLFRDMTAQTVLGKVVSVEQHKHQMWPLFKVELKLLTDLGIRNVNKSILAKVRESTSREEARCQERAREEKIAQEQRIEEARRQERAREEKIAQEQRMEEARRQDRLLKEKAALELKLKEERLLEAQRLEKEKQVKEEEKEQTKGKEKEREKVSSRKSSTSSLDRPLKERDKGRETPRQSKKSNEKDEEVCSPASVASNSDDKKRKKSKKENKSPLNCAYVKSLIEQNVQDNMGMDLPLARPRTGSDCSLVIVTPKKTEKLSRASSLTNLDKFSTVNVSKENVRGCETRKDSKDGFERCSIVASKLLDSSTEKDAKCTPEETGKVSDLNQTKNVTVKTTPVDMCPNNSNEDIYWVDTIPIEKRRNVPLVLPNVKNLFYNKIHLRKESWREIELMNVRELLATKASNDYFALRYDVKTIEKSLNHLLPFPTQPVSPHQEATAEFRKYMLGFCFNKPRTGRKRGYYIFLITGDAPLNTTSNTPIKFSGRYIVSGLAKIEGCQESGMSLQYSCLSCIGKNVIKFDDDLSRNRVNGTKTKTIKTRLPPNTAKNLLLNYKDLLETNKCSPTLPGYYPWCGVPPLMDMQKPEVYCGNETSKPEVCRGNQSSKSEVCRGNGTFTSRDRSKQPDRREQVASCENKKSLSETWQSRNTNPGSHMNKDIKEPRRTAVPTPNVPPIPSEPWQTRNTNPGSHWNKEVKEQHRIAVPTPIAPPVPVYVPSVEYQEEESWDLESNDTKSQESLTNFPEPEPVLGMNDVSSFDVDERPIEILPPGSEDLYTNNCSGISGDMVDELHRNFTNRICNGTDRSMSLDTNEDACPPEYVNTHIKEAVMAPSCTVESFLTCEEIESTFKRAISEDTADEESEPESSFSMKEIYDSQLDSNLSQDMNEVCNGYEADWITTNESMVTHNGSVCDSVPVDAALPGRESMSTVYESTQNSLDNSPDAIHNNLDSVHNRPGHEDDEIGRSPGKVVNGTSISPHCVNENNYDNGHENTFVADSFKNEGDQDSYPNSGRNSAKISADDERSDDNERRSHHKGSTNDSKQRPMSDNDSRQRPVKILQRPASGKLDKSCQNDRDGRENRSNSDNEVNQGAPPLKIQPRPLTDNKVGFYDKTGMWYPDMEAAVIAFKKSFEAYSEDEFMPKDDKDENDNVVTTDEKEVTRSTSIPLFAPPPPLSTMSL